MKINILEENNIPYIIRKKERKTFTLKYDECGNLIINQPLYVSDSEMENYIIKEINWIKTHRIIKELPHEVYNDGDDYLFLGKHYKIHINYNNYEDIKIINDCIFVYTYDDKRIPKLFEKFRYEQADIIFNETLYRCYKKMEDVISKYPKLEIKASASKWGCCTWKENLIMLNIALIHTPIDLIEYVCIHELCHLLVHNHSKNFHALNNFYNPGAFLCRKKLKSYSPKYR